MTSTLNITSLNFWKHASVFPIITVMSGGFKRHVLFDSCYEKTLISKKFGQRMNIKASRGALTVVSGVRDV